MRSRIRGAEPARLEAVRRRFELWRRTREGRSRIPDVLWNSAVKLSATYGIHRTAKTLRLNPDSLEKHVASADGNGSRGPGKFRQEATTAFIELVPPEGACSPECIVELEDPRGTKMRIHVKGNQTPDVVTAVSRVLFGAMP